MVTGGEVFTRCIEHPILNLTCSHTRATRHMARILCHSVSILHRRNLEDNFQREAPVNFCKIPFPFQWNIATESAQSVARTPFSYISHILYMDDFFYSISNKGNYTSQLPNKYLINTRYLEHSYLRYWKTKSNIVSFVRIKQWKINAWRCTF